MELKYLWDTNTVIYYLQQQFGTEAEELMDEIAGNYQICISTITEIELYCWRTTNPEDLKVLSDFVADATVIELEKEIKFQTARRYAEGIALNFLTLLLLQQLRFTI